MLALENLVTAHKNDETVQSDNVQVTFPDIKLPVLSISELLRVVKRLKEVTEYNALVRILYACN